MLAVQIENNALYFRDRALSKCGSFDLIDHIPGGGGKKVYMHCCLIKLLGYIHISLDFDYIRHTPYVLSAV